MSDTKHSPAPWETSRDAVPAGHVQVTVYDTQGNRVATVFQSEANVALIATAPELLDACKTVLRDILPSVSHKPTRDRCECSGCASTRIVSAAIAKAEGN